MVTRGLSGQSTTEFVMILALLTAIGVLIMTQMTGQGSNAIGTAESSATTAIQND